MKKKWLKKILIMSLSGLMFLGSFAASAEPVYAATVTDNDKDDDEDDDKDDDDKDDDFVPSTSEFLKLADNYQTQTVQYGQSVIIALPVVNYSKSPLKDVVVTAKISNLVSEWPFVPNVAGATQTIRNFPAYDRDKDIHAVRQDIGFNFVVREDVKTGYYPIQFDFVYTRDDVVESCTLTTFVQTIGKEDSGYLDESADKDQVSKPRIIVTGFETVPAQVYAGDTFTLKIHMKNTSDSTAVSNVLFDLQAVEEGTDKENTFAAFLPTSGSSSVYMDSIAPGQTKDIVMEMSDKSDLAQKPYVLDVNMKYDAKDIVDLTDKASVSVPIYQAQRCETGDAEINPESIEVGNQANIMFDVYNTGKTTLYNVWVKFQGDTISGGDTFLGTINSGATGSVDAMVTGVAGTMDDGTITALISFENESGVVTTIEKPLTLMVMEFSEEGMMDDGVWEDGNLDEAGMENTSNSPVRIIVLIVILVVIAAIVIIVLIRKRNKKKKERLDLEAELEAIDEDH